MNSYRYFRTMKCLFLGLVLATLEITLVQARESTPVAEIDPPESILFVGNSFTFYNNAIYTHLRKLLVAEDASSRQRIFLKSMTISGAMLADHAGGLEQLLASREWDVVVLQGQSREAIEKDMAAGFESTARTYSEAIRARGAEPVLFMTWAYAGQPEMTAQLAAGFEYLGKKLDVMVIPVGLAFRRAIDTMNGVVLHDPDKKHPSLEGTYLAAAVFYASLYGKSPVPLAYNAGLDETIALQLRQAAWQTVSEYYRVK